MELLYHRQSAPFWEIYIITFYPETVKTPMSFTQYNKYKKQENFKKFKIENGNIVWGKDWDLIFPVYDLYEGKID